MESNKSETEATQVWLVSFGDLLTLLLCFFLTIVSLGPLNPATSGAGQSATNRINKDNQKLDFSTRRFEGDGIQLAAFNKEIKSVAREGEVKRILLTEQDFGAANHAVLVQAREALKSSVIEGNYSDARVRIQSCSAEQAHAEEDSYTIAQLRALAIRRQLIDLAPDLHSGRYLVRNLGSSCDLLQQEGAPDGTVAVIEIEGNDG